jgi:putative restriction endonuclease
VVSDRVRTEFNNGNEYRRLHGQALRLPPNSKYHPDPARLQWHRENRFVA